RRVLFRSDGVATHPTRHAHALEDAAGRGAGADRSRLAVVAVRTVGGADTSEAVSLHDAGEALALARGGDVDDVAGGEQVRGDLLADLVGGRFGGAQLDERAAGG